MSPCPLSDRPVLTSTRHELTPTSTWEYTITFGCWFHGGYIKLYFTLFTINILYSYLTWRWQGSGFGGPMYIAYHPLCLTAYSIFEKPCRSYSKIIFRRLILKHESRGHWRSWWGLPGITCSVVVHRTSSAAVFRSAPQRRFAVLSFGSSSPRASLRPWCVRTDEWMRMYCVLHTDLQLETCS